ncbi:hypothetical protein T07_1215 [Trichinella nelsoni]|uniref:Uncharacterized protein n=1 Tax=Trichinella nelsoni TaxID=6336 RepID=A0A0V0RNL6_9BILA|nr:hypothetical protein T07_1215 [Trichinella nelsoni]
MSVLFLRQLAKQVEHLISVAADEHAGIIILIRGSISVSQGSFWPATDSILLSCPVLSCQQYQKDPNEH